MSRQPFVIATHPSLLSALLPSVQNSATRALNAVTTSVHRPAALVRYTLSSMGDSSVQTRGISLNCGRLVNVLQAAFEGNDSLFHRIFASLLHFNFTSLLKIEFNVTVNGDMSLAMQLPSYIQSANAKLSPQGTPQLTEVGAASRTVLLRI